MRNLVIFSLLLLVACGSSPNAPSSEPPVKDPLVGWWWATYRDHNPIYRHLITMTSDGRAGNSYWIYNDYGEHIGIDKDKGYSCNYTKSGTNLTFSQFRLRGIDGAIHYSVTFKYAVDDSTLVLLYEYEPGHNWRYEFHSKPQ